MINNKSSQDVHLADISLGKDEPDLVHDQEAGKGSSQRIPCLDVAVEMVERLCMIHNNNCHDSSVKV